MIVWTPSTSSAKEITEEGGSSFDDEARHLYDHVTVALSGGYGPCRDGVRRFLTDTDKSSTQPTTPTTPPSPGAHVARLESPFKVDRRGVYLLEACFGQDTAATEMEEIEGLLWLALHPGGCLVWCVGGGADPSSSSSSSSLLDDQRLQVLTYELLRKMSLVVDLYKLLFPRSAYPTPLFKTRLVMFLSDQQDEAKNRRYNSKNGVCEQLKRATFHTESTYSAATQTYCEERAERNKMRISIEDAFSAFEVIHGAKQLQKLLTLVPYVSKDAMGEASYAIRKMKVRCAEARQGTAPLCPYQTSLDAFAHGHAKWVAQRCSELISQDFLQSCEARIDSIDAAQVKRLHGSVQTIVMSLLATIAFPSDFSTSSSRSACQASSVEHHQLGAAVVSQVVSDSEDALRHVLRRLQQRDEERNSRSDDQRDATLHQMEPQGSSSGGSPNSVVRMPLLGANGNNAGAVAGGVRGEYVSLWGRWPTPIQSTPTSRFWLSANGVKLVAVFFAFAIGLVLIYKFEK